MEQLSLDIKGIDTMMLTDRQTDRQTSPNSGGED